MGEFFSYVINEKLNWISVQFNSVVWSCPTLCDPMDYSMPGFPVHHQVLKLVQTHDHHVGDAMQPSHPLLSLSPPAFNLSYIKIFSNELVLCIKWPKYWSFSISPFNIYKINIHLFILRLVKQ